MGVINLKTGQEEDLDPVAITQGLVAGTHVPPPGQGVLLNPDGDLVFVPKEDVPDNVQRYGYRIPNPDELTKLGRDFKYNTDMMGLQAGLAGAARGGTFGASDWLAVKTGLSSPEHLSALKEYFPGVSLLGEIGGAVATAPLAFTPAGAVVNVARGAEAMALGRAASMLPKSAMANAIAKAAVETGGKALGGAIEGLAFGLGQSVSEAALGDPDLTAEKVISNLGHSAVLGGALGGAFNVGMIAARKALNVAKKGYQAAYEKLIGKTIMSPEAVAEQSGIPGFNVSQLDNEIDDDIARQIGKEVSEDQAQAAGQPVFEPGFATKKMAKAASVFSGVPEEEILEKVAAEMDPKRVVLSTAEKDAKVKTFADNLQQIYEVSKKLTGSMGKFARPQEMENLLIDVSTERPMMQLMDVYKQMATVQQTMAKEPLIYSPSMIRELELMTERLGQKIESGFENSYSIYKELVTNRQLLEDMELFNKMNLSREQAKSIYEFITPLRQQIRSGLMDQDVWGMAGARQAAYNEKLTNLLNWTKALEKTVMKRTPIGEARDVYEVNNRSINMMFNQINDTRSKVPARSSANFLKSVREYIEQAEESIKNAPQVKMDVTALKDFTNKLADEAMEAKQYVSSAFGGYGFFRDLMDAAKSGGVAGLASQIGTAFTNPDGLIKTLSWIEKQNNKVSKAMEKTSVIFQKLKTPTKGIGVFWENMSPSERLEKYKDYIDKMKNLTDVPDNLLERLDNATIDIFEAAPKTSASIQMALVRGITFLQEKMPKPLNQGILDAPYEPSQADIIKFGRYVAVVEDPTIAIDQLEANYVPPETIETLNRVYPAFYSQLKTKILDDMTDQIAQEKLNLPYQKRMVLSRFLQVPLDNSMKPETIQRNQMMLVQMQGQKNAEEEQRAQASQAGLKEVSLADRNRSTLQKVIERA